MRYCAIQLIALISLTFLANGQPFSPNDQAAVALANPAAAAAPPAGAWAPTNAYAWYDATMFAITNGGIANGVCITNWTDLVPSGHDLHIRGATTDPRRIPYFTNSVVNTNCAVVWTNDGSSMACYGLTNAFGSLLTQPWTLVMVLNANLGAGGTFYYMVDGIDNTKQQIVREPNASHYLTIRATQSITSADFPPTNTWYVLTAHWNFSTSSYLRTNGVLLIAGDTQSGGWSGMTLGSAYDGANGIRAGIAEVILYHGAPATNDLQWTEKKLAEKYGLTYYGQ